MRIKLRALASRFVNFLVPVEWLIVGILFGLALAVLVLVLSGCQYYPGSGTDRPYF